MDRKEEPLVLFDDIWSTHVPEDRTDHAQLDVPAQQLYWLNLFERNAAKPLDQQSAHFTSWYRHKFFEDELDHNLDPFQVYLVKLRNAMCHAYFKSTMLNQNDDDIILVTKVFASHTQPLAHPGDIWTVSPTAENTYDALAQQILHLNTRRMYFKHYDFKAGVLANLGQGTWNLENTVDAVNPWTLTLQYEMLWTASEKYLGYKRKDAQAFVKGAHKKSLQTYAERHDLARVITCSPSITVQIPCRLDSVSIQRDFNMSDFCANVVGSGYRNDYKAGWLEALRYLPDGPDFYRLCKHVEHDHYVQTMSRNDEFERNDPVFGQVSRILQNLMQGVDSDVRRDSIVDTLRQTITSQCPLWDSALLQRGTTRNAMGFDLVETQRERQEEKIKLKFDIVKDYEFVKSAWDFSYSHVRAFRFNKPAWHLSKPLSIPWFKESTAYWTEDEKKVWHAWDPVQVTALATETATQSCLFDWSSVRGIQSTTQYQDILQQVIPDDVDIIHTWCPEYPHSSD